MQERKHENVTNLAAIYNKCIIFLYALQKIEEPTSLSSAAEDVLTYQVKTPH